METLLTLPIQGHIGEQPYKCTIRWRNGVFIADEPVELGGGDLGPDPYSLLLASLASCTLSTLRMYIQRKGWQVPEIQVSLNMTQEREPERVTRISRDITFSQQLTDEQSEKLRMIADKCPVSLLLKHSITIHTNL
jgi:putative redox protein